MLPFLKHLDMRRRWRRLAGSALPVAMAIYGLLAALAFTVTTSYSESLKPQRVPFTTHSGKRSATGAELRHKVWAKQLACLSKMQPMRRNLKFCSSRTVLCEMVQNSLADSQPCNIIRSRDGEWWERKKMSGVNRGFGSGGFYLPGYGLPPFFRARCEAAARLEHLIRNGGNPECELAVSRSLEWLSHQQNDDGSWGKEDRLALTSLALLAYLGRCETPDSPFYGDRLMASVLWLIERAKSHKQGLITALEPSQHTALDHALAVQALGEMYLIARISSKSLPGMREGLEQGVGYTVSQQLADGGWAASAHGFASEGRGDVWLTIWQLEALSVAKATGLRFPGFKDTITRAAQFLQSRQAQDGSYGTVQEAKLHGQTTLTAGALKVLHQLRLNDRGHEPKGYAFLNQHTEPQGFLSPDWPGALWLTEANFFQGGSAWHQHNQDILAEVEKQQQKDAWHPPDHASAKPGMDALLRFTLLRLLQIEVYYRRESARARINKDIESFFDK